MALTPILTLPSHQQHATGGGDGKTMTRKQRYIQSKRNGNKQGRKFSGMLTMVFIFGFVGLEFWNYVSPAASVGTGGGSSRPAAGAAGGVPSFMTDHQRHSRSLLEASSDLGEAENATDANGTHGACHEPDPFTAAITSCDMEMRVGSAGFVVLYIFIIYNIFLGIAILCDDYFLGALEGISEALDLSEDVAGATFMAAGSSAPELFTALAGVAMGHAETGAGTIVGSAVFNILIIIALSAVMVPDKLLVDWRCIFRDGSFYGISIILFIIFSYDSVFELYEAIILLLMYVLYVVMMYFNQSLMAFLANCCGGGKVAPADGSEEECEDDSKDDKSIVELPATAPPSEMGDTIEPGMPGDLAVTVVAEEPRTPEKDAADRSRVLHARSSNPEFSVTSPAGRLALEHKAVTMIEMKELSKSDSALKHVTTAQPHHSTPARKLTKDDLALSSKTSDALSDASKMSKIKSLKRHGSLTIGKVEYYSSSEPDLTKMGLSSGRQSKRHGHFHHKHKHNMPWSSHAAGMAGSTPPSSFKGKRQSDSFKHRRGSMNLNKHPHSREGSTLSHNVTTATSPKEPTALELERQDTMDSEDTTTMDSGGPPHKSGDEGSDDGGSGSDSDDEDGEFEGPCAQRCCFPCIFGDHPDLVCGASADPDLSFFGKAGLVFTWFNFVLGAPYQWLFRNTIPYARYYWSSFAMNILWIIILSLAMVAVVQKLGCILGVDAFTMGFCVIAVGTSVPDALGSMLVARDGFADMAVSNAIGSNVFDINLGLGFPYLILILTKLNDVDRVPGSMPSITLEACGRDGLSMVKQGMLFAKFGCILLGILVVTVITFILSKFQLTKPLGITFVFMYVATVVYAILSAIYCEDGTTC